MTGIQLPTSLEKSFRRRCFQAVSFESFLEYLFYKKAPGDKVTGFFTDCHFYIELRNPLTTLFQCFLRKLTLETNFWDLFQNFMTMTFFKSCNGSPPLTFVNKEIRKT